MLAFVEDLLPAFVVVTYLVWVHLIMIVEPDFSFDKYIDFDICQYSSEDQLPVHFISYYSKVDDDLFN